MKMEVMEELLEHSGNSRKLKIWLVNSKKKKPRSANSKKKRSVKWRRRRNKSRWLKNSRMRRRIGGGKSRSHSLGGLWLGGKRYWAPTT